MDELLHITREQTKALMVNMISEEVGTRVQAYPSAIGCQAVCKLKAECVQSRLKWYRWYPVAGGHLSTKIVRLTQHAVDEVDPSLVNAVT